MDKALTENLDRYIAKLQNASHGLKLVRTGSFFNLKRNNTAIANKSPQDFLAYCALVQFVRRNLAEIARPSCVALVLVPSQWHPEKVETAAKLVFGDDKRINICIHPTTKHKRGWEIDAAQLLASDKLIVFARDGSAVHEDLELAATITDRLDLATARHVSALSKLRGCGALSNDQVEVILRQPAERMEAIFRRRQPASRAADRLIKERDQDATKPAEHLNLSQGFGEAGVWAQELKKELRDWQDGRLPWSEIDKGCLLYGPPGTGKTRFAAALAAECGIHLEATSVAKWQSFKDGDLGDMLKAMFTAFDAAKENAPALLFIDEIDAIGDRSNFPSRHQTYSTTVVNALLECLDGIESREGVIVVGACNYPQMIDAGILRSGRLEKHVEFPLPDANARAGILAFHLPTLASEPALKKIADRLPGKSGADLERLCRDARRSARKAGRSVVIGDLSRVIETPQPLTFEQLFKIAVHEAGHALVGHAFNLGDIQRVEVFDNVNTFASEIDAHGITVTKFHSRPITTKWDMMKLVAFNLAGAAAEELWYKTPSTLASGGKDSDFATATMLAIEMVTKRGFGSAPYFLENSIDIHNPMELWKDQRLADEVNQILETELNRARGMLDGLLSTLAVFATTLVEKRRLEGDLLESLWPDAATEPEFGDVYV
ncbi:ATP-dependent zinc metalloprotease FtsH 2 [Agrobacterium sp. DSM 25558]|uniref:AAA family ATPase n=1 Tax=Agrobacterium sp. DSM 25558 TaxID=1907665 RepID=UPI0009724E75|nr:AAA family ATPase [Agrobacterium sp. DSM 25558]SCX28098.1 ATP-dependent zinc metalloprotease FtsH 2 [Agrobacterium sp. DSM 25558]